MEKQVKLFLEFLENDKKASDNTLQSYRRDIVYFNKYVESNQLNYAKTLEYLIISLDNAVQVIV